MPGLMDEDTEHPIFSLYMNSNFQYNDEQYSNPMNN